MLYVLSLGYERQLGERDARYGGGKETRSKQVSREGLRLRPPIVCARGAVVAFHGVVGLTLAIERKNMGDRAAESEQGFSGEESDSETILPVLKLTHAKG